MVEDKGEGEQRRWWRIRGRETEKVVEDKGEGEQRRWWKIRGMENREGGGR